MFHNKQDFNMAVILKSDVHELPLDTSRDLVEFFSGSIKISLVVSEEWR